MKVILLYITIIFLNELLQCSSKIEEKFTNNKNVALLLTSTISPSYISDESDPEFEIESRTKLYDDVIKEYLENTNVDLFIVESSGIEILKNKYKNESRINYYCFEINSNNIFGEKARSTSELESFSIMKAIKYFKLNEYDKILKITGRYYIPNIERIIDSMIDSVDMYVQERHSKKGKWQSSEIFGMKSNILPYFMYQQIKSEKIMENYLFNLYHESEDNKNPILRAQRFPSIKLNKIVVRGGDKARLNSL